MRRYVINLSIAITLLLGLFCGDAFGILHPPFYTWLPPSTFDSMSRGEMFRIAYQMKDFGWSPLNEIYNDPGTGSARITYSPLSRYSGIPYSQKADVQDWENFYHLVSTVSASQNTAWGNDCSGFVSISWKLPQRYNTTLFYCDAFNDFNWCNANGLYGGDYVDALGMTGSAGSVSLKPGDALVTTGHIMLVNRVFTDGVEVIHQTPYSPQIAFMTYTKLSYDNYTPIRRKKVEDYFLLDSWTLTDPPTGTIYDIHDLGVNEQGEPVVVGEYGY